MRPITLELEGFGPFRDRATVDFDGAELFAIVGPTGHGKSTLIDAICFALYAHVPRHGERELAPVVTLGAADAKVSLTFALGEQRYRVARVVHRNPDGVGATTCGVRLEELRDDGTAETIATSVRELEPHIRTLVGLDFDQFTKCVVLPQGQFAAFLHATSGDRSAILGALLGLGRYERMARAARDRATQARGTVEALEGERARIVATDGHALEAGSRAGSRAGDGRRRLGGRDRTGCAPGGAARGGAARIRGRERGAGGGDCDFHRRGSRLQGSRAHHGTERSRTRRVFGRRTDEGIGGRAGERRARRVAGRATTSSTQSRGGSHAPTKCLQPGAAAWKSRTRSCSPPRRRSAKHNLRSTKRDGRMRTPSCEECSRSVLRARCVNKRCVRSLRGCAPAC